VTTDKRISKVKKVKDEVQVHNNAQRIRRKSITTRKGEYGILLRRSGFKTRMMVLPEDGITKFDNLYNFSTQCRHWTDGRTDRQTDGRK